MRSEPAELLKEALTLPPEVRASMADSLLESLDPEADEGVEAAWLEEVQIRLHHIDAGVVELVPWDEARRAITAKLNR